jgi:hypothetical protein
LCSFERGGEKPAPSTMEVFIASRAARCSSLKASPTQTTTSASLPRGRRCPGGCDQSGRIDSRRSPPQLSMTRRRGKFAGTLVFRLSSTNRPSMLPCMFSPSARSSAGQSVGLLIRGSGVRIPPGAREKYQVRGHRGLSVPSGVAQNPTKNPRDDAKRHGEHPQSSAQK